MLAYYPATRPVRSSAVGFDPVTVDEARLQCFLASSNDSHDTRLQGFIQQAREQIEKDASLVIATGTYTYKLSEFPVGDFFELYDLKPVTAISSIAYVATDATTTTWSSAEYALDTHSVAPLVKLGYGYSWPTIRGDVNGITVTVVAGYASRSAVPARIKEACKLHISWLWWLGPGQDVRQAEATERAYEAIVERLRRDVYA